MVRKTIKLALFLSIYLIALWIGFRSGEMYNRMRNKVQVETIAIPTAQEPDDIFYVVEEHDYGAYKAVEFAQIYESHIFMRFLRNSNLKPLLGRRKIEIYNLKGDRIY